MRNKNINLKTIIILVLAFCFFQPQTIKAQKKPTLKKQIKANLTARQIADKVLPSVVLIITLDENEKPISQGSGFVIGKGLVVSNLHVFERATNAIVKNVKTGEISKAIEVVGMNAKEDICVIRIENTKFPVLALGDSNSILTGDEIYVASNPKGLEGSFAKGIVSSLRTDLGLFQVDAAISSGSSGGVLLNQKAEAIGIIKSSLVSGQNLNFAIPINKLKSLPYKFKHPILLAGACAYQDKDKEKLNGFVKSVIEKSRYTTFENGKLIQTPPLINRIRIYDLEGNKIEDKFFTAKGVFESWSMYEYDENRLLVSLSEIDENGDGKQFTYNLKQSIDYKLRTRKFSESLDLFQQDDSRVFDSYGNLTTRLSAETKITYEYDAEGRTIEEVQSKNNKIQIRSRYRYKDDRFGNWIEQTAYSNFPNSRNVNSDDWIQGETEYREISYYE